MAKSSAGQRSDSMLVKLHAVNKYSGAYTFEVSGNSSSLPAKTDTIFTWRVNKSDNFLTVFIRPENVPGSRHMLLYQMMFPVDPGNSFIINDLDSVTLNSTASETVFQHYQQQAAGPALASYCDSVIGANGDKDVSAAIILSQFCHNEIPDSLVAGYFARLDPGPKLSLYGKRVSEYLKGRASIRPGKYFSFGTLQDIAGKPYHFPWLSSDYTLVEFWFSDCLPCKQGFVLLDSLYRICGRDRFQVITISCDAPELQASWKSYLKKLVWPWLNLLDANQQTTKRYAITLFPTKILLDRYLKILILNPTNDKLLSAIRSKPVP